MNRIIDLQTALLDMLQKLHDSEVRLIAGGGFGGSILKPIMLENWARERFWTNGQSRDPRTTSICFFDAHAHQLELLFPI